MQSLGSYPSTPIPLPNRYVPAKSVSKPAQFPSETATSSRQPEELTAESWPAHELQVDFSLPSTDSEELDQYPIFYDLTPLETTPEVVYEMLFQLVDPESWEENGGDSASVIESIGHKRILFVRTTGPHHDAIARFFEGLSQAVGIPPLRSNWRFEWVPAQVQASMKDAAIHSDDVEVFQLPRSGLNFDSVREMILETIEPERVVKTAAIMNYCSPGSTTATSWPCVNNVASNSGSNASCLIGTECYTKMGRMTWPWSISRRLRPGISKRRESRPS